MSRTLMGLALLALAGCATQPLPPVEDPQQAWAEHRARLEQLERWQISGRMALATAEDSWQADLYWSQEPGAFRIRLIAPLGQGTLLLEGAPGGAQLRTSAEPEPVRAVDAEALLRRVTGWRMPVESLRYWVRGLPAPGGRPRMVLDPQGRLASLEQFGWRIDFRRYRKVDTWALPDKVFLHHDDLRLRLLIREWSALG